MIYLTNFEGNVKMGFDFLAKLPEDIDASDSKFEKWVPFVLSVATEERAIAITEDMQADMTLYEAERILNGLKALLESVGGNADQKFTHYSSESYFEISFEYLVDDDCFNVELWFITAKFPKGETIGYDAGFRFVVEKSAMQRFVEELLDRFNKICPQCSI
jgi:hypothetical protein